MNWLVSFLVIKEQTVPLQETKVPLDRFRGSKNVIRLEGAQAFCTHGSGFRATIRTKKSISYQDLSKKTHGFHQKQSIISTRSGFGGLIDKLKI